LLTVEMSEADLQSLAKVAPQADPIVERFIHAGLGAAYGTHGRGRERLAKGPATETPMLISVPYVGAPASCGKI
jgi:hypothetical protein